MSKQPPSPGASPKTPGTPKSGGENALVVRCRSCEVHGIDLLSHVKCEVCDGYGGWQGWGNQCRRCDGHGYKVPVHALRFSSYGDQCRVEDHVRAMLAVAGLHCGSIQFYGDGDADRGPRVHLSDYSADGDGELTFAHLEKVAQMFRTKDIDLGYDHGCASDRSFSREMTIWSPRI